MHPLKTTRIHQSGEQTQIDIREYLFVHAQRLENKTQLRPINTMRYPSRSRKGTGETQKAQQIKELRESEIGDNDDQAWKNLYQRGLGLFNKLVVYKNKVTCTCENFHRFGKCEDSELMHLVCFGEGPMENTAIDFDGCKEGFSKISKRLGEKLLDLVDTGNVRVNPPPQDPTETSQDPTYNK